MTTRVGLLMMLSAALGALAACSTPKGGDTPPGDTAVSGGPVPPAAAPSPAAPARTAPSAVSVPREFSCDPLAVTTDTSLALRNSIETLLLRPTGAPCANRLVYTSASGAQHELSTAPGMIVLADVQRVGTSLVACLSNERHLAGDVAAPLERTSDGVQLECAVRTSAWSATVAVVAPSQDYAAWVVAVEPDPDSADKLAVRWLRDSTFQFAHTVSDGRPETDGIYRTELTIKGGALVTGVTTKLDVPMFEVAAQVTNDPL